jgi:hypothetical protein
VKPPKADEIDLVRQLLDRPIIDRDEMPCGKVDDIELKPRDDGSLDVTALLVGPGAWSPRLPALFEWLGQKIAGTRVVRVGWDQIDDISGFIKLTVTAGSLGLEESRHVAFRIIEKIPWSSRG